MASPAAVPRTAFKLSRVLAPVSRPPGGITSLPRGRVGRPRRAIAAEHSGCEPVDGARAQPSTPC